MILFYPEYLDSILNYATQKRIDIYLDELKLGKLRIRDMYTYLTLDFPMLVANSHEIPTFDLQSKYATIIEDLPIHINKHEYVDNIIRNIGVLDERILDVVFKKDFFKKGKRTVTATLQYQDKTQNITKESVATIRNNIIHYLVNDLNLFVYTPQ